MFLDFSIKNVPEIQIIKKVDTGISNSSEWFWIGILQLIYKGSSTVYLEKNATFINRAFDNLPATHLPWTERNEIVKRTTILQQMLKRQLDFSQIAIKIWSKSTRYVISRKLYVVEGNEK